VNRLGSFLDAHKGVRVAVLWAGFVIASVGTCLGVGVYALTTGPKAIGNYVTARARAVSFLSVALILNIGLAWVLGLRRRMGGFFPRLVLSALLTVGGAIMAFGVIVGRALLWHALR
jgi:hypothetical protein